MAAAAFKGPCLILEAGPEAGRKLLVSGSGQCNFTHDLDRDLFLQRCGAYGRFLKPALYQLGPHELISQLVKLGCPAQIREDGKVFPASMKAADVRDALLRAALNRGARVEYNARIKELRHQDGFEITGQRGNKFQSEKLVIACGGASWPQTGSDGSGFELARQLGHKIISPHPALASVNIKAYPFRSCAGISISQAEALLQTGNGRRSYKGDLLFTHNGLSGPLILDNSHLLKAGDTLRLRFMTDPERELQSRLAARPKSSIKRALRSAVMPEALILVLIRLAGIDPDIRCADVYRQGRLALAAVLGGLELEVASVESLATAMLTAGGVDLAEVKARDMSSKLVPGLSFAGEVLDYMLPSGGFNIQAACSTGWLAGSKLAILP